MTYPTRLQLLNHLTNNKPSGGEYHDKETIYNVLHDAISNYGDETDIINDKEDLYDDIWREADSNTPTYNDNVLEWFNGNYTAIDDYHNEVGSAYDGDIIQTIRAAYCWSLQQETMSALDDLYTATTEALNPQS